MSRTLDSASAPRDIAAMQDATASTSLEQACRERGLQLNKQRLAVIEVLATALDHPTAEEIYLRVAHLDAKMSIATVYRALAVLAQNDLVFSYEFGDRKLRYEDATRGAHNHLIDTDTGVISNFKDDRLSDLLRELALARGYDLRDYRLDLLCVAEQSGGRAPRAS